MFFSDEEIDALAGAVDLMAWCRGESREIAGSQYFASDLVFEIDPHFPARFQALLILSENGLEVLLRFLFGREREACLVAGINGLEVGMIRSIDHTERNPASIESGSSHTKYPLQ